MVNFVSPSFRVTPELFKGVCAIHANGVEGDVAEFGTMTGTTAHTLALALKFVSTQSPDAPSRQLHLFDSFKGLPQPEEADSQSPLVISGEWGKGTHVGLSSEELLARCVTELDADRIRIFEGWFSDTIPTVPVGTSYAMIHIDSDLYSSARDVLFGLFDHRMVADGAVIFFDDWNCNKASPRFGERRAWRECVEEFAVEYSDLGDYGLVSHKLVVHGYRGL